MLLERPNDDRFLLHPPALIGELGALTSLPRSTRATVAAGSTVWALDARRVQDYFASHQELGLRFLVNLLSVVADKCLCEISVVGVTVLGCKGKSCGNGFAAELLLA